MDISGRIRSLGGMGLRIQRVHDNGQRFPVVLYVSERERESQWRRRKREEGQMRQGRGCSGCWLLAGRRAEPTGSFCCFAAPRSGRVHLAEANFGVVRSYCVLTPQHLSALGIGLPLQSHYDSNFVYLYLGEEIEAQGPMQGV